MAMRPSSLSMPLLHVEDPQFRMSASVWASPCSGLELDTNRRRSRRALGSSSPRAIDDNAHDRAGGAPLAWRKFRLGLARRIPASPLTKPARAPVSGLIGAVCAAAPSLI